jgi:hypothetical protein
MYAEKRLIAFWIRFTVEGDKATAKEFLFDGFVETFAVAAAEDDLPALMTAKEIDRGR